MNTFRLRTAVVAFLILGSSSINAERDDDDEQDIEPSIAVATIDPCGASGDLATGVKAVVRGDVAAAVKLFFPMANRGCAEAMHNLGFVTAKLGMSKPPGSTVERDLLVDAYMWFTLAVEHHPPGSRREDSLKNRTTITASMTPLQIALAERLAKTWAAGEPLQAQELTTDDYRTAFRNTLRLAQQGLTEAQRNLGVMYYHGQGVSQDYSEAAKWYRRAAEQGDAPAQSSLSDLYYKGQGVPKDVAEAVELARKAAEQGYKSAQFNLGDLYARGRGVPQDDDEALRWYRRSAEQGDVRAQHNLSVFILGGRTLLVEGRMQIDPTSISSQDKIETYKWAFLASLKKNPNARNMLRVLQSLMTSDEIVMAKSLAKEWRPVVEWKPK